jgi:hypothetical protein
LTFGEVIIRLVIGGFFVSAFAILSDILKPKSFAGLFGAAPSIALAALLLTVYEHGPAYATVEARWMIGGALAFCIYALAVTLVLTKSRCSAKTASILLLLLWVGIAIGYRMI